MFKPHHTAVSGTAPNALSHSTVRGQSLLCALADLIGQLNRLDNAGSAALSEREPAQPAGVADLESDPQRAVGSLLGPLVGVVLGDPSRRRCEVDDGVDPPVDGAEQSLGQVAPG